MRDVFAILTLSGTVAFALCVALSGHAFAAGVEPSRDLQLDPAPCVAASAASDDNDRIISICGALVDNAARSDAGRYLQRARRAVAPEG
jgi:hypothetical protein